MLKTAVVLDVHSERDSDSDDSLANLFVKMHPHKQVARTVSLDCLVCGLHATSSSQLHKHMTGFHVRVDLYQCFTCDS